MKAVVTLCIGKEYSLGELTHPLLAAYAKKVDADFIVIDSEKLNLGYLHYEKYQIYDLLERYERIIYLDTDVIVTPECPNLFEIVPEEKFGAFLVSNHTYFHDGSIKDIQNELGNINWERTYFNSGVMVVSQAHRQVFSVDNNLLAWAKTKRAFIEQTILNYTIQKLGIEIHDIDYKFNHTTHTKNSNLRFGRRINQLLTMTNSLIGLISPEYLKEQEQRNKPDRYIIYYKGKEPIKHRVQSYIIHYTGKGHRQKGSKLEQIRKDLSIINNNFLASSVSFLPFIERFI
ncbi:glycosyltransferase [Anabaena sp. UHCC 0399]|uniref:glycosyltransferase n=1 Tax=Anabaena sp. UHCC 0399 TaxID=3110238 RepID=UPI002B21E16B|nr:glycosyltransferase [Anabaena sp. UHCC 0399]MEA5565344.1 glycosyltransferase [Anabaena sp. UHCC 0399]